MDKNFMLKAILPQFILHNTSCPAFNENLQIILKDKEKNFLKWKSKWDNQT